MAGGWRAIRLAVVAGERKVVFKSMTSSLYSAVQENVEARKSEQRIEQRKFLKLSQLNVLCKSHKLRCKRLRKLFMLPRSKKQ